MTTRLEADQSLRSALQTHAEAYELTSPGEMLADYAIVCHWLPEVSDDTSRYTSHFSSSPIPQHVALGLFQVGFRHFDSPDE